MEYKISQEAERLCLSSLLKFNKKISDISHLIKPEYFSDKSNGVVYSLICELYAEKGLVDESLLLLKLNSLKISEINSIDVKDYLDILIAIPVREEFFESYFLELVKFFRLKKCYKILTDTRSYITSNLSLNASTVFHEIDKRLSEATTSDIEGDVDFVDLFGEMEQEIKDRAEQTIPAGLETGHKIFDSWYGGLYFGDLYVFAAPAKKGKSTFLNDLALRAIRHEINNVRVLFLDTELESFRVMTRSVAARTGVNEWYFKQGKFKHNKEIVSLTEKVWEENKDLKGRMTHVYVANRTIDEISSICKRWYARYVKPGESALIIYDYIKLTGEKVSDSWKEYQVIGEKTDKLKKLASLLPNTCIATSVQINAGGDIAMSQQLKWFASNVYKLEPKTPEEITKHGEKYGTHKLIEIATRNQGEQAKGMNNLVKMIDNKGKTLYTNNYICFDFKNFKVEEVATLEDILATSTEQIELEEEKINEIDF